MVIGTISCKAFLPIIYMASVCNIIIGIITLTIASIILLKKMKDK